MTLDDTLRAIAEAQANIYAKLNGIDPPFAGLTVVDSRSYSETTDPTFDYVLGLEDGPHEPPEQYEGEDK